MGIVSGPAYLYRGRVYLIKQPISIWFPDSMFHGVNLRHSIGEQLDQYFQSLFWFKLFKWSGRLSNSWWSRSFKTVLSSLVSLLGVPFFRPPVLTPFAISIFVYFKPSAFNITIQLGKRRKSLVMMAEKRLRFTRWVRG